MSKQTDSTNIVGIIGLAVFFIVAYPFIWLYEQVGKEFFFIIVLGIPATILVYKDWKKNRLKKTSSDPAEPA